MNEDSKMTERNMRPNNRIKNLLIAGAVTGLLLATLLALGFRGTVRAAEDPAGNVQPQTLPADMTTTNLQAENAQLRSAVNTLLNREGQYQQQLELANQTILQLQSQLSQANGQLPSFRSDDHGGFDD